MTLFDSTRRYQRLFTLTAEELESPTTAQIEDTGSIYQLDVPPYTRYTSNGEELVAISDASNIDALVAASTAVSTALSAISGAIEQAKFRPNQTGDCPAQNIRFADGTTLEAWKDFVLSQIAEPSPSAPELTTVPTFTSDLQGIIQSNTFNNTTVTNSHVVSFTSDMVAGHAGVVGIVADASATITSIVDNMGDSWTKAVETNGGSNAYQIWYRANLSTGVDSITIGLGTSSAIKGAWYERDDILSSDAVDQSAGALYGSGTTFTSGATAALDADGISVGLVGTLASGTSDFSASGWSDEKEIGGSPGFVASMWWKATTNASTPAFSGTIAGGAVTGRAAIVAFHKATSSAGYTVGDDVFVTSGSVTDGPSGTHYNEWVAIQVPAGGGAEFPIPGTQQVLASASSYSFKIGPSLYADKFYVQQTVLDGTNQNLRGNSLKTALSTAVAGTLPANSVAPSISPSGSQATGQLHTVSTGTWTGASTYEVQFYRNGAPHGVRSTTATITTDSTFAGQTLTYDVIGVSSLGVRSAPVAGSNSVALTGTGVVVNTVAPAWPADVYLGVQAALTQGTWTGTINQQRRYDFYRNGTAPANQYFAGNLLPVHTPRSSNGVLVGDTLYFTETVTETDTGTTYSAISAGKVVTAALGTLALNPTAEGTSGYTWTAGQAITQAIPFTISGGTAPYSVPTGNFTPSITGLTVSVSGTNVIVSGTPSSAASGQSYSLTVQDAVGATATGAISAVINSQSVQTLAAMPFPVPLDLAPNGSQSYNGSSTVTVSATVRRQLTTDPAGTGFPVYMSRLVRTDHNNGATSCRNETIWNSTGPLPHIFAGDEIWMCFALRPKLGEHPISSATTDNIMSPWQTHSESSGDTQPDLSLLWDIGRNRRAFQRSYSAASQATTPQSVFTDYIGGYPLVDTWYGYIVRWKLGFLASHAPATQIWEKVGSGAWTQVVNKTASTDFNTYNWNTGSYLRIGQYKWAGTEWTSGLSTIAMYSTNLYAEKTTGAFNRCAATLAPLMGS